MTYKSIDCQLPCNTLCVFHINALDINAYVSEKRVRDLSESRDEHSLYCSVESRIDR